MSCRSEYSLGDNLVIIFALIALPLVGIAFYAKVTDNLSLLIVSLYGMLVWIVIVLKASKTAKKGQDPASREQNRTSPQLRPSHMVEHQITLINHLEGINTGAAFRENADRLSQEYFGRALTTAEIELIASFIDAKAAKARDFRRTDPVALVRMARGKTDVTTAGASWLGGVPSLGGLDWPKGTDGRPMHHLAQIALADLPEGQIPPGLARDGSLAFFIQTAAEWPYPSRVVYIPQTDGRPSAIPSDLPLLFEGGEWGYYVKGHTLTSAPRIFPRWAVETIPLPQPDPNRNDAAMTALQNLFPHTDQYHLSRSRYRDTNPELARLCYWDAPQKFANSLAVALENVDKTIASTEQRISKYGERYRVDLETLISQRAAFTEYVKNIREWAFAHSAWTLMEPTDYEKFETTFREVRDFREQKARFKVFYEHSDGRFLSVDDVVNVSLRDAISGPSEAYATLPAALRADIDQHYRLPRKNGTHQMFGLGTQVQVAVEDHFHDHLLLQLQSDQMMGWMWGDVGVIQFWISDEDLNSQNWNRVEMTIEGH